MIPLDLQAHYGRREIVQALGTADPGDARKLHAKAWVALNAEFDAARGELAKAKPSAEPEAFTPIADISPTLVSITKLDTLRDQREEAAKAGQLPAFMRLQRDTLAITQAMLDGEVEATKDYRELEGLRNGLRAFLTGENSHAISAARAARASAPARAPAKTSGKGTPLATVVDRGAAEQRPKERTVKRTRNIVERFEEVNGKLTVEAVTKQHVVAFKDALIDQGSSPANINVMLPMLGTVMIYAVDKLHLIDVNPAARIRVFSTEGWSKACAICGSIYSTLHGREFFMDSAARSMPIIVNWTGIFIRRDVFEARRLPVPRGAFKPQWVSLEESH